MGNNKSHDVVMVPFKRTREEWTEYISISPVICSRAGLASIYLLRNQIIFELVNQNETAYYCYAINALEPEFCKDVLSIPIQQIIQYAV